MKLFISVFVVVLLIVYFLLTCSEDCSLSWFNVKPNQQWVYKSNPFDLGITNLVLDVKGGYVKFVAINELDTGPVQVQRVMVFKCNSKLVQ